MNETWYDYVLSEFPGEEAFARVTLVEGWTKGSFIHHLRG